jgi:hypothetical protein
MCEPYAGVTRSTLHDGSPSFESVVARGSMNPDRALDLAPHSLPRSFCASDHSKSCSIFHASPRVLKFGLAIDMRARLLREVFEINL